MKHLLKEFRFWTIHVTLTSLTSFVIAYVIEFNQAADIAAMIAAIFSFVLIFTALTSLPTYQKMRGSLYDQAIRLGTKIRMWVSLTSLPIALLALFKSELQDNLISFLPDYWCGLLAGILTITYQIPDERSLSLFERFINTYLLTMTEGMVIAGTLVMVSFFALIIVNARARREAFHS